MWQTLAIIAPGRSVLLTVRDLLALSYACD